jgi:hypothetical protein
MYYPARKISSSEFALITVVLQDVRSGSQIPSLIVMPGFVAPGYVAAFRK